ncbi:MAG: ATP-binding protein, partial [Desulfobacteraceae bacterium]
LWLGLPPWILLGAVLVLAPIFIFWAAENIRRQQENTTRLLVEKGAALIRAFEAGARTGMRGMMGSRGTSFKLGHLLEETAQQPDIVHILVTDPSGRILAHNDPDMVGEAHGSGLDLERISTSGDLSWRRVAGPDGAPVFEVYRRFLPDPQPVRLMRHRTRPPTGAGLTYPDSATRDIESSIIFVGLDVSAVDAARHEEARHTVVMAIILLMIGFAGIFTLFVLQAYKTARTSLSRVRAFSDHLVESMPIGLAALDGEGRITAVNRAALEILGLEGRDAVVGRTAAEVLPQELIGLVRRPPEQGSGLETEVTCTLEGGERIPLAAGISSLEKGEEEGAPELLLLFRDVTEVQNLKNEVERSRRLASVGRLAAGVAHEIRNPLSSIKGFATYFKERCQDRPQDRKTADILIQEVDRLNRVIGQLLDFARPLRVEKRPHSLQDLVHHSLRMVEEKARKSGVRLEAEIDPGLGPVYMDRDRIGQALLNLMLNSIEAMPEGGILRIAAAGMPDRDRVRIRVEDTGTGINEEDLEHVFDPYFTTKSSGTGLGLAIAHKIIESHGGEMAVESRSGEGTRVSITLPMGPGDKKTKADNTVDRL